MTGKSYYIVQLGSPKSVLYHAFQIDEHFYRAVELVFGPNKFDILIAKKGKETTVLLSSALECIARSTVADRERLRVSADTLEKFRIIVARMHKTTKQGQNRMWYYS